MLNVHNTRNIAQFSQSLFILESSIFLVASLQFITERAENGHVVFKQPKVVDAETPYRYVFKRRNSQKPLLK